MGDVEEAVKQRDLEWFQIIESIMDFHPVSMTDALNQGIARSKKQKDEVARLRRWIDDLQANCFINCVYCGHRYGPDDEVPASMADVLKEHVEQCPDHPMSHLKKKYGQLQAWATVLFEALEDIHDSCGNRRFIETCYDAYMLARSVVKRAGTALDWRENNDNGCEHEWVQIDKDARASGERCSFCGQKRDKSS